MDYDTTVLMIFGIGVVCLILGGYLGVLLSWNLRPEKYIQSNTDYGNAKDTDTVTVYYTMTVRKRWVPHINAMFKEMQYLGAVGSSRTLAVYSDGDGDFRPKFEINGSSFNDPETGNPTWWGRNIGTPLPKEGYEGIRIHKFFDAG